MALVRCDSCPGYVNDEQFTVLKMRRVEGVDVPLSSASVDPDFINVRVPNHVVHVSTMDPAAKARGEALRAKWIAEHAALDVP